MPQRQGQDTQIRLADVIAVLSLATDLGSGLPLEHALRSCLLAVNLATELGLSGDDLGDVYYVALLAYAGCTADTQLIASVLGDEIALGPYLAAIEYDRPAALVGALLRHVGESQPPLRRAGLVAAALAASVRLGPDGARAYSTAHCEVAQLLADRLGFGPTVHQALGQVFERWDGRGHPRGLTGTNVVLPVRLLRLAQDIDSVHHLGGAKAAIAVARQRAGAAYDPSLDARFCQRASTLLAPLEAESAWEAALAAEPGAPRSLSENVCQKASR